jgi:hypothetical protein
VRVSVHVLMCMDVGVWSLDVGGWRCAVGVWRLKVGGWRCEVGDVHVFETMLPIAHIGA